MTSPNNAARQLIVPRYAYDRQIFNVSANKFSVKQFPPGSIVTIRCGVTGPRRQVVVKKSAEVGGAVFGCPARQIAILTKPNKGD